MVTNDELYTLFPLPSTSISTAGMQDGIILKFKTFYLKIYDSVEVTYRIQGFRYHEQIPVFEKNVKVHQMREFANQFTKENYLLEFQEPCDDPYCVMIGNSALC